MTVIAMAAMATMIQTAQASTTDSLADLIGGGSLTIGDKTFTGFSATPHTALAGFDPSSITVVASIDANGIYYLDFQGPVSVNNLGGSGTLTGDLLLKYTVTANPGSISMIDQDYTPNTDFSHGDPNLSSISIGETVKNSGVTVGNSSLTLSDLSDPIAESGDNLFINPSVSSLAVSKDILITAGPHSLVGLSDVEQSFHQVPEPTTIIAGVLLLLPLGASTLRIVRKNRMA